MIGQKWRLTVLFIQLCVDPGALFIFAPCLYNSSWSYEVPWVFLGFGGFLGCPQRSVSVHSFGQLNKLARLDRFFRRRQQTESFWVLRNRPKILLSKQILPVAHTNYKNFHRNRQITKYDSPFLAVLLSRLAGHTLEVGHVRRCDRLTVHAQFLHQGQVGGSSNF